MWVLTLDNSLSVKWAQDHHPSCFTNPSAQDIYSLYMHYNTRSLSEERRSTPHPYSTAKSFFWQFSLSDLQPFSLSFSLICFIGMLKIYFWTAEYNFLKIQKSSDSKLWLDAFRAVIVHSILMHQHAKFLYDLKELFRNVTSYPSLVFLLLSMVFWQPVTHNLSWVLALI